MADAARRRATYQDVLDAPPNVVAEVIAGTLYTHPRPRTRHARASSRVGDLLGGPFDRGVGGPGGWIQLHFLPPYCPDENRIERMWRDLHDNVTRNHQHGTLEDLCFAVSVWLDAVSPWPPSEYSPCMVAA